jgi:large subunit ribosomal protein L30
VTTDSKKIKVTLIKSPIGAKANHRASVKGLGLRNMRDTVEVQDTPAIRGMINVVSHLVKVG